MARQTKQAQIDNLRASLDEAIASEDKLITRLQIEERKYEDANRECGDLGLRLDRLVENYYGLAEVNAKLFTIVEVRALLRRCFDRDLSALFESAETYRDLSTVLDTVDVFRAKAAAVREREAAKDKAATEPAPPRTPRGPCRLYLDKVGQNWVGAIKAVRQVTSSGPSNMLGLKEAKDLVDAVRGVGVVVGGHREVPSPFSPFFGSPVDVDPPGPRLRTYAEAEQAAKVLREAGCEVTISEVIWPGSSSPSDVGGSEASS